MVSESGALTAWLLPTLGSVSVAIRCPSPDWYYRRATNKCYFVQGNQAQAVNPTRDAANLMTWNEAITECQVRGGEIITVSSEEELEWIRAKLNKGEHYWTGLTYETMRWEWFNGVSYTAYTPLALL
ncbi:hypothetical protein BV898_03012 [Hypsibius exemplaris]|uniref:C-type lectin domain-containing protein n=1 Tax=Hypsibius exemplaris TaxID=2072580 RepID=A0A1W0X6G5_HYPEX|nr:hypothetical protein BV898_03012 [Hypsibius exemplaris]